MELKGVEWTIYTLIILLAFVVLLFVILLTMKCLKQTSINTRSLCCVKQQTQRQRTRRQRRRQHQQQQETNANSNQNENNRSSESTYSCSSASSAAASSDSDSDDIETTNTQMRQSDFIHDNHGFISDFDNSTRLATTTTSNPVSFIINRKYDDSSRFFHLNNKSNSVNCNLNKINTISSSIGYTLNLDDNISQQIDIDLVPQLEVVTLQGQDNQSVQIDFENTNQMRTVIEDISTLSNCSILTEPDDLNQNILTTNRLDTNSTDEIPPNYEQIITDDH